MRSQIQAVAAAYVQTVRQGSGGSITISSSSLNSHGNKNKIGAGLGIGVNSSISNGSSYCSCCNYWNHANSLVTRSLSRSPIRSGANNNGINGNKLLQQLMLMQTSSTSNNSPNKELSNFPFKFSFNS